MVLFLLDEKLLVIADGGQQTNITDNVTFFQGSSLTNQIGGPNRKTITCNNTDGGFNTYAYSNGTISFMAAAFYFVMYASQIGSPSRNGEGEIHIWVQRANIDKPNTNRRQSIERGSTSVLIAQSVLRIPAGFPAPFVFSTYTVNPCSSLGLIVTSPENEPVVPSLIRTAIQLSDFNNSIPYAQLTSPSTQLGNLTPAAVRINTTEANNVVDLTTSGNDGALKYNTSGLYFVIACGQVGSDTNTFGSGEVHLWTRINEVDVPNSNTIQTIRNGSIAILVSQTIVTLKANDTLKLMFSTTDKRLGMIASTPTNESAAPSMIFSTFRLRSEGESLPYRSTI